MAVHNLKDYKRAKVNLLHLEAILKVYELSTKGLSNFEIYVSVQRVLPVLKEETYLIKSQIRKLKKIIEEKGKV